MIHGYAVIFFFFFWEFSNAFANSQIQTCMAPYVIESI